MKQIPGPPSELHILGSQPHQWLQRPKVAIVGSRKVAPYGRQITAQLSSELSTRGVVIISGMALGVDSIAHQAARMLQAQL